jgi:hypothetical protein
VKKRFKSFFFIFDMIFFSVLILLVIAANIGAFLTPQDWDVVKVLALTIPSAGLIALCFYGIIPYFLNKPTFEIEKYGMAVWAETDVTKETVEKACDHFVAVVSKELGLDATAAISDSFIEFHSHKVSMIGVGWIVSDKMGLQQGKGIKVAWLKTCTSIDNTAFYHELGHMLDEFHFNRYDPKHENAPFWSIVSKM